jgi:AraC-like DNA-binding protein
MSAAEGYAERHRNMRRADVLVEQKVTASKRLGMVRVSQQGMQFGDPPTDAYLLTAPLYGGPYVECDFGGFGIKQRTYAGDYIFQPIQTGASGYADSPVTVQMTVFDGPWLRSMFQQLGDGAKIDFEPAAVRTWRDGRLETLLHQTWSRIDVNGGQDQALVDMAALKMAEVIVRRTGVRPRQADHKPLTREQFGRVHDLIEADLSHGIGVAEMATAAGVSPFHFMRRFRATRGESPHQFLMARRLARAHLLVTRTSDPLAVIAVAAGYSSQAHMTAAFRSGFGVTPAWFRKKTK